MFKKLLETISKIIIESVPFFIILGTLSLFKDNYSSLYQFKFVLQKYILPIVITYKSGLVFDKKHGGFIAVLALNAVMLNYNIQSFLEPILIGMLSGWLTVKFTKNLDKIKLPGYEMLFNNMGIAIFAGTLSLVLIYIVPFYKYIQVHFFIKVTGFMLNTMFLPLFAILIEPAKVFFLNNLINHSFLSIIGFSELEKSGKSIFFLLETNPGPGLGLLLAYYFYEKKEQSTEKTLDTKSNIFIHLIGGIHEVYFPYVLRNMKLLYALIAGGISGIYVFHKLHTGLVSIASPGSIILITFLAPLREKIPVLLGIFCSSVVTFLISYRILKSKKTSEPLKPLDIEEIHLESIKNLVICVACDAGMGSSAMGATLLRKKLEKEKIDNIKVINSSIDSIPPEAGVIIVHKQLSDRIKNFENRELFIINDFMDSSFYDVLVKNIKELAKKEYSEYIMEKIEVIQEISTENIEDRSSVKNRMPKVLEKENIYLGLKRTDKESALKKAGEILAERGYVSEEYIESILEREKISSTYLDYGIAIPHCTGEGLKYIKNSGIVILQYPYGINYGEGKTVYLVIAIASIKNNHSDILSKLAELFDDYKIAEQLSTTVDINEVYESFSGLEETNVK